MKEVYLSRSTNTDGAIRTITLIKKKFTGLLIYTLLVIDSILTSGIAVENHENLLDVDRIIHPFDF